MRSHRFRPRYSDLQEPRYAYFQAACVLFCFCATNSSYHGEEPIEGYGASVDAHVSFEIPHDAIVIEEPTVQALTDAFNLANETARPTIVFPQDETIWLVDLPPPRLTANNLVIEGNGATIRGDLLSPPTVGVPETFGAVLDIAGHDVLVRNLHVRNGYDNIRIQGEDAYNVVLSHISTTGALDDGIGISKHRRDARGPRDITIQYSFLAGNSRSLFIKNDFYDDTHPDYRPPEDFDPEALVHNISIHHNWIMKQWVRGPIVDGVKNVDLVNNLIEDWSEWGTKFQNGSQGNVTYNIFRQSDFANDLGVLVDPSCRASVDTCGLDPLLGTCKGDSEITCNEDEDCEGIGNGKCKLCKYDGNGAKAFRLTSGTTERDVFTDGNWYQGNAGKRVWGEAAAFQNPPVFTIRYWADLEDEILARSRPCPVLLSGPTQDGSECPARDPIDQDYIDAQHWCVNEGIAFRPTTDMVNWSDDDGTGLGLLGGADTPTMQLFPETGGGAFGAPRSIDPRNTHLTEPFFSNDFSFYEIPDSSHTLVSEQFIAEPGPTCHACEGPNCL